MSQRHSHSEEDRRNSLLCDFRPLNNKTVKDTFPLPRIDASLSRIGNAKIFTTLDLAWTFWQVPLKKRDRKETAFACELGQFEWRRMPFGLCNASATFHRSITRALQRIQQRQGSVVMAYIDDIGIATETIVDHLVMIKEVFDCPREAGFKMRAEKKRLYGTETKYLGKVVTSHLEAMTKIQEWRPVRNKEEFQFTGVRELLSGLHSLPCCQSTTHAGATEEEPALLLE